MSEHTKRPSLKVSTGKKCLVLTKEGLGEEIKSQEEELEQDVNRYLLNAKEIEKLSKEIAEIITAISLGKGEYASKSPSERADLLKLKQNSKDFLENQNKDLMHSIIFLDEHLARNKANYSSMSPVGEHCYY